MQKHNLSNCIAAFHSVALGPSLPFKVQTLMIILDNGQSCAVLSVAFIEIVVWLHGSWCWLPKCYRGSYVVKAELQRGLDVPKLQIHQQRENRGSLYRKNDMESVQCKTNASVFGPVRQRLCWFVWVTYRSSEVNCNQGWQRSLSSSSSSRATGTEQWELGGWGGGVQSVRMRFPPSWCTASWTRPLPAIQHCQQVPGNSTPLRCL